MAKRADEPWLKELYLKMAGHYQELADACDRYKAWRGGDPKIASTKLSADGVAAQIASMPPFRSRRAVGG